MQEIDQYEIDDLALIEQAAREAGKMALGYFGQDFEIWYKGIARSPVSEADLNIDQYLKQTLLAARPDYGWLSEETEDNARRLDCDMVFVVDPIDGTRSFIANKDEWCISIAIVKNGQPVHGVLFAPVRQVFFSASLGKGAQMNNTPVKTSRDVDIGSPARLIIPQEVSHKLKKQFAREVKTVYGLRSLALRIAGLANNDVDGLYVRQNSRDWDMAAAHIIVSESGYKLVDLDLNDVVYNKAKTCHNMLIATRPDYLATMRNVLEIL